MAPLSSAKTSSCFPLLFVISSSSSVLVHLLLFLSQITCLSFASNSYDPAGNYYNNTDTNNGSSPASCVHDQNAALLQLKHGFLINRGRYNLYSRLDSWNPATDCCYWEGITCDEGTGQVNGLHLGNSLIEGRLNSSSSLFNLHHLQKVDLSWNNFYGSPIPSTLGQLTNLTHLDLSYSFFSGQVPLGILRLTKLVSLNLSHYSSSSNLQLINPNLTTLTGNLSSLRELLLDAVYISGEQDGKWASALSIALPNLNRLSLCYCALDGPIDQYSLFAIPFLSQLILDGNNLSVMVPNLLSDSSTLTFLSLIDCNLYGDFPESIFLIPNLQTVYLQDNPHLTIHFSEFPQNSALQYLFLSNTSIHEKLPDSIGNLKSLKALALSNCNLSGLLPLSIAKLTKLEYLFLSSNNFSGTIPSTFFDEFQNLTRLSLLNNSLEGFIPSSLFAFLSLQTLVLSKNQLTGTVGLDMFQSLKSLFLLALSDNSLSFITSNVNMHLISSSFQIQFLYLRSCNITEFPNILQNLNQLQELDLSNNQIHGEIPSSICNTHSLKVLDLSNNNFNGNIPNCLGEIGNSLKILNLQGNAFQGTVPESFKKGCSLRTLNLERNQLEGPIPRSLVNCKMLEILDLGDNHLNDAFPFWLENQSHLRILILRSNKFYGPISLSHFDSQLFPVLQFFDLSSNSFTGIIPPRFFSNWKAMIGDDGSNNQIIRYELDAFGYYQDSMTVTMKGLKLEFDRISTAMTSIDLSNNRFEGGIPTSIGHLKLIWGLNFSQNYFTGSIPTSFGNLIHLEPLDLSRNMLSGEIPRQLTELNFLQVLNLSQNLLYGSIPQSQQFLTFTNNSFLGNDGLCGPPLSKKCEVATAAQPSTSDHYSLDDVEEIDWKFMWIGFALGSGFGLGIVFWTLALWKNGSQKYFQLIDKMFINFSNNCIGHMS